MPDSKPAKPAGTNGLSTWIFRYVFALAAVGAAFLLRAGLTRLGGGSLPTYITYYPVVMLAALIGGLGPGILATAAVALLVNYYVLAPINTFSISSLADAIGLAFFSGMGVFMSVVAELYRRSRHQAAQHETEFFSRDDKEAPARWSRQNWAINAGIVVSLALLVATRWQPAVYVRAEVEATQQVAHTRVVMLELERLLSALTDEETGQRGYLLTGEEKYLEPYQAAINLVQSNLAGLKQLTQDNAAQQKRLAAIESLIVEKEAVIRQTIELRRTQGLPSALNIVLTDKGKALMDQIRQRVVEAQNEEERLLAERIALRNAQGSKAVQSLLAGGVLVLLLMATVFFFLKQENSRRTKAEMEVRHHRDHLKDMVAERTVELARANDALRQQREWLSVTLNSIGDAVLATDTAGHVTFLNPVAQSLLGCLESEVLGRPVQKVFQIINEQTHESGEDIVARALRENKIIALANHTALISRDGREIPIEDSAAPIRDEHGTVSGVVLVFHDVTAKRRAQEALRESQARYRSLFDAMIEGFCVIDVVFDADGKPADYRFLEVNPAFEKQTGLHNAQGRLMRELAPEHEDHWFEIYGKVAMTGQAVRFCEQAKALNRWYEVSAYRVGGTESRKVAIFFSDVTEREQVEAANARLAAIVETSDDAIIAKDLHGTITSWNGAAQRLFGYALEEVIGCPIKLLIPAERQQEEEFIMGRLIAGERIEHYETVGLTKDGRAFPVSATLSPLKDGAGRVIGASKIVRDISERKSAEEKLRRQAEELQASNDILSRFNNAAVGRELRMIELKKEINELCVKLGQEPSYPVASSAGPDSPQSGQRLSSSDSVEP